MSTILLTLSFILMSGISSGIRKEDWNIELVQIVFRNGFSAPKHLYPSDPNHPEQWEDGLDQLTLVGRKQMYAIGKELRKRYNNFITANPHEVSVYSSADTKCMDSALCLLASMYAPTPTWEFRNGFQWQPVPVFYLPSNKDNLLGSLYKCPSVVKEMEKLVDYYGTQLLNGAHEKRMKYWTSNSRMPVTNWNQAAKLFQILSAENSTNQVIPEWAWKYWRDFQYLNDFSYRMNFGNAEILKLVGGPLLYQMVRNAVGKSENSLKSTKVIAYSGEAEHVSGVLGALGCFNNKEPPFASTLLVELFKRKSGVISFENTIRLSYINETTPQIHEIQPKILVLPGCSEFCPLDYVANHAGKWKNRNWNTDCGVV